MKIRPVGTELIHTDGQTYRRTDGQTNMTKLLPQFYVRVQKLQYTQNTDSR